MTEKLINTFEELKKYVFIINRKDKRYKYIKKNPDKFNHILENQTKEKDLLKLRISTFSNILDLLKGFNTSLYILKMKSINSLYNGDYRLTKMYEEDICCLLGLKIESKENKRIYCCPNSWMASNRINRLVEFKRPIYMESISMIPAETYNEGFDKICI